MFNGFYTSLSFNLIRNVSYGKFVELPFFSEILNVKLYSSETSLSKF